MVMRQKGLPHKAGRKTAEKHILPLCTNAMICIGLLSAVLCLLLSGCARKELKEEVKTDTYRVYYLNGSATRLTTRDCQTEITDPNRLISFLMTEMIYPPQDMDGQSALSEKVQYLDYKREDMVLYLYFDNNYVSMNPSREILCRAALAKTLTQVNGIDFINIYVGEQPLADSDGNPVGMMAASDFIESISDVNAFEKTELTLYFTNETGDRLVQERRQVVHNTNTSLEKLVIEQLTEGPETEGIFPTLPSNTKLLNVSVNENVCYLNFDSSFMGSTLEVNEFIPIYSIVNSLAELATVNKVQFTINGSQDAKFRDLVSFNTLFERNLDLQEDIKN